MTTQKILKPKSYLFYLALQLFLLMSCTYSKEKNILIPYEINGKVGFVNQELKKITDTEFNSYENTNFVIGKYCANALRIVNNKKERCVLLYDGTVVREPNGLHIGGANILGDEYYSFSYKESPKTEVFSVFGKKKIASFDGIRIFSTKNIDYIPAYKYNYVSLDGKLIFPDSQFEKYAMTFSFDSKYGVARVGGTHSGDMRIVNTKGDILNKEHIIELMNFSCGMAAGRGESGKGYYDHTGKLGIKVEEMSEIIPYEFHCNVLPCIFEKGKIYAVNKRQSNNWAIIDKSGNPIKENIEALSILEFSDDGVAVLIKKEKEKHSYYLIDTQGNFITDSPYDKILSSINGYCIAQKDGVDYLISAKDGTSYKCLDFK